MLPRSVQLAAIEPLTQSSGSMKKLVAAIENGRIAKDLSNTNQLLKWSTANEPELNQAISRVWDDCAVPKIPIASKSWPIRSSCLPVVEAADPLAGEAHFKRICFQCHKLHGQGMEVGPDISANGRGSFEQLVSNVMDPSLVIGQAFTSRPS